MGSPFTQRVRLSFSVLNRLFSVEGGYIWSGPLFLDAIGQIMTLWRGYLLHLPVKEFLSGTDLGPSYEA